MYIKANPSLPLKKYCFVVFSSPPAVFFFLVCVSTFLTIKENRTYSVQFIPLIKFCPYVYQKLLCHDLVVNSFVVYVYTQ